ncbi:putative TRAP-type C4-dicarboxylate transport system, large permease component [Vibrio nigripulchritudo SFn27]|uniref:TRAP transporter large permease protein n=1 Tax=Vibrio nigripulchritudo TaxID=28173 RepID=U4KBH4_9VIBR|nr:TRAP transporter large permease [Vibrio nigripulchritudo]CCN82481.1 putative TRAP-type C4-dicarboxylate transport system, large permease component [Vibrio nigripulchritudo BLFn1]CCN91468.1 putative TRAP-type C4-dicarboxylate transport system, large permease component [Vibrio nigripulchritudo SFn27]CCN97632.1 putative TRAP-type C4-dicarboxylate transport system, large permease component [Vibrio nigripulchritudo ENn2]CCO38775.1 putative TRAP-type C4-dicarboxylate transport system, large permea
MIAILFIAAAVFIFIGLPVAVSLAGASLLFILVDDSLPSMVVLHRMVSGVDSFPLLAVPFFILAGNLMNSAGITNRIFDFAKSIVGWLPGGLGHVNVGGSVVFAGMSGAAVADAGGLGAIELKAMREAGYDTEFSVGITAASSTIGPIIPPSLPMVIYGVLASASIGKLFAAGLIPGLMMAVALMLMIAWYAKRRNYPVDSAFSFKKVASSSKGAFLSLLTPIIVVGGITTGVLTPTEAAIAAVAWALFLGSCVYRTLNLKRLAVVSLKSIETTAVVLFVVAAASIFAWLLTNHNIATAMADGLMTLSENKYVILSIILLLLLVIGCFMETIAAMTILVPVMLPTVTQLGVDPVHFGVIMVLTLMISLLTPPVGVVLYVLSSISKLSFERCVVATMPFLVPLVIVLLIVTFMPGLVMWLPNLLYP